MVALVVAMTGRKGAHGDLSGRRSEDSRRPILTTGDRWWERPSANRAQPPRRGCPAPRGDGSEQPICRQAGVRCRAACARQTLGVGHVRAVEGGAVQLGGGQIESGEVSMAQVGASEVGTVQVGPGEVGSV